MDEKSIPKRFIAFTPENLSLSISDDRNVIIKLLDHEKEAGMAPGVGMMMVLSPAEARQFAEALQRTANKDEEGLPRA